MRGLNIGRYLAPALFLLAALIFGTLGIAFVVSTKNKDKRCTDEARGTVYEIEVNENSEDHTKTYRLLFTYEYRGKEYDGKSSISSSSYKSYKVGDTLDVKVDPENPEEYIFDLKSNYLFGYVFTAAGIVIFFFAVVAAAILIFGWKKITGVWSRS